MGIWRCLKALSKNREVSKMHIFESNKYRSEIDAVSSMLLPWERLKDCRFLITGACGMIGSYMVDALMSANVRYNLNLQILAMGRRPEQAQSRFASYWNDGDHFQFVCGDVNATIPPQEGMVDYIFHAASNTHPVAYATDPIGTICTNIIGTNNLLQFAVEHHCKRFIFASTVEIYGENRGDCEYFDETYSGYIDCNTLRAGYPESKRAGEALCQAYKKQKNLDVVIPRLPRVYGPTLLTSDTKALSQFMRKAVDGEDIVLKSDGSQFYSYLHVADAVSGVLHCLFYGENGEAYNISSSKSDITLRELATKVAELAGRKVVFELPDQTEQAGFSKATKAVMASSKLQAIGWSAAVPMDDGLKSCYLHLCGRR